MTPKLNKHVLPQIACLGLTYLIVAYVQWEPDPSQWDAMTRGLSVFAWLTLAAIVAGAVEILEIDP